MRLGGFVIHGSNADTLGPCLDSLRAVCDEVVAVDSGSEDGSAELVRARGVTRVEHRWRGYGSARARAVASLSPECELILFLDSDERLRPESIERIRAIKDGAGPPVAHALPVYDWAELPEQRFLFRIQWRKRLVPRALARWEERMIVHEALPSVPVVRLDAPIDHRFATSIAARREKEERYALLWALQADAATRQGKPVVVQRVAHFLRNAMIKGAAIRGGRAGARLSWQVAAYHQRKYVLLAAVRAGAFEAQRDALARGDLGALFAGLPPGHEILARTARGR